VTLQTKGLCDLTAIIVETVNKAVSAIPVGLNVKHDIALITHKKYIV
jgi:hypothetical protein